jgi:hypothetical protein
MITLVVNYCLVSSVLLSHLSKLEFFPFPSLLHLPPWHPTPKPTPPLGPSTNPTPRNIIFLTPNGRFEVRKKICLSISAYHPESWQPAWGIRTILEALISFFPTKGEGAVGALDWTTEERQRLVPASAVFCCRVCQKTNQELIPPLKPNTTTNTSNQSNKNKKKKKHDYADQIAQMHMHAATGKLAVGSNDNSSGGGSGGGSGGSGSDNGGSGGARQNVQAAPTQNITNANAMRQRQAATTTQSVRVPASVPVQPHTQTPVQQQQPPIPAKDSSVLLYLAVLLGCGLLFLISRKVMRSMGRRME